MANNDKNYKIDEAKKIIYADILALTEKEEAEVNKFLKFGYTISNKEPKKTVKRLDDEYIIAYLEKHADEKAIAAYNKAKNEEARDEDGNLKYTIKDGKINKVRKKGFNAGRNWFSKRYPEDVSEALTDIENAKLKNKFEKAYEAYSKKEHEPDETLLTKEQYTRDFYWKKVFIKPEKDQKTTTEE